MPTWTYESKSNTGASEVDFLFSDGTDFLFSDGTDYVFVEGTGTTTWSNLSKNSATWSFVAES